MDTSMTQFTADLQDWEGRRTRGDNAREDSGLWSPELDVLHAHDPQLIRCLEPGTPFKVRFHTITSLPGVPRSGTCYNSVMMCNI